MKYLSVPDLSFGVLGHFQKILASLALNIGLVIPMTSQKFSKIKMCAFVYFEMSH